MIKPWRAAVLLFFFFFLPRDSWTLSGKKSFRNVDRFVEWPRPSSSRCFCDWWGVYEWARGTRVKKRCGLLPMCSRPAESTIPWSEFIPIRVGTRRNGCKFVRNGKVPFKSLLPRSGFPSKNCILDLKHRFSKYVEIHMSIYISRYFTLFLHSSSTSRELNSFGINYGQLLRDPLSARQRRNSKRTRAPLNSPVMSVRDQLPFPIT